MEPDDTFQCRIGGEFETPRDMAAFLAPDPPTGKFKKHKWTPDEDNKLLKSVEIHGTKNWIAVASMVPNRNPKQCRERYTTQINPALCRDDWTPVEDTMLIQLHERYGNHWAKIANHLNGRSSIAVKNRYHLLLRKSPSQFTASRSSWEAYPGSSTPEQTFSMTPVDSALSDPFGTSANQRKADMCNRDDKEPPEPEFDESIFNFEQDDDVAFREEFLDF